MKQKLSKFEHARFKHAQFEQNIAIYEQMVKDEQKAAVKLLKRKIRVSKRKVERNVKNND